MNTLCFKCSLGWITISEENNLITSVKFGKKKNFGKKSVLTKLKKQIIEFTKRKRQKFNVKIYIQG